MLASSPSAAALLCICAGLDLNHSYFFFFFLLFLVHSSSLSWSFWFRSHHLIYLLFLPGSSDLPTDFLTAFFFFFTFSHAHTGQAMEREHALGAKRGGGGVHINCSHTVLQSATCLKTLELLFHDFLKKSLVLK